MGGGGGGKTRETVVQQPSSGPQIAPELQPFVKSVGERGLAGLGLPQFDLSRFAQDQLFQVPGLSPLEQFGRGQIQRRTEQGYDIPQAERQAEQTFTGFANGDMGNSAAVQQAKMGLENQIIPVIQNQAAKAGVAQSGFLPQEVGRAYARELVPLYTQGMQQQMQAGQYLNQLGQQQLGRQDQLIRDSSSFGELERQLQNAQEQSKMEQYLRQREVGLGLYSPLGMMPQQSVPPSSVETIRRTSGGSGWLKALLPWFVIIGMVL